MRHYRSPALTLCPVSCVVSRETAFFLQFHSCVGTRFAKKGSVLMRLRVHLAEWVSDGEPIRIAA